MALSWTSYPGGACSPWPLRKERELTGREPDTNKRTNKRNAEAGKRRKASGQQGGKAERRSRGEEKGEHRREKKRERKEQEKRVEPAAGAAADGSPRGQQRGCPWRRPPLDVGQAAEGQGARCADRELWGHVARLKRRPHPGVLGSLGKERKEERKITHA